MEFWTGPWWIIVIVLAVGSIVWAVRREIRKHARQMAAVGRDLGLTPGMPPRGFIKSVAKKTFLFSRGGKKKVELWLEGDYQGLHVCYFEYEYRFGVPPFASITYRQSVAAFPVASGRIPAFQLRPASSVEKLATKFGYPALHFDSHRKFSSDYLLQGPEESRIRQHFLPPLLDFFEQLPKAEWCVDSSGEWLFVYLHTTRFTPAALAEFLDGACHIATAVVR